MNIVQGRIVDTDALVEVMELGHLAGYAGDVWYPQPTLSDRRCGMPSPAPYPNSAQTDCGVLICISARYVGPSSIVRLLLPGQAGFPEEVCQ